MIIKKNLISNRFKSDGRAIRSFNERQIGYRESFNNDSRIHYLSLEKCPLCKHKRFIQIAEKDRYGIDLVTVVCEKCGLVFTYNQMDEQSAQIFYKEYYRKIYTGDSVPSRDVLLQRYGSKKKEKIPKFIKKNDVIVEIGTGGGWNLMKFKENGNAHYGFDFDEDYIGFGKEVLGLNLFIGGVKEIRKMNVKADYLLVLQVLEHTSDPLEFLIDLKDILNDNALLNLQIPSLNFLITGGGATGHDLLGTLQCAHNFLFDEFTLRYLAYQAGYEIVSLLGGHILLRKVSLATNNHLVAFEGKIESNYRSEKTIKYLKIVDKLVNVKNKLISNRIESHLHYFYYFFKPIDLFKKLYLFC